jgi:predicted peptidase
MLFLHGAGEKGDDPQRILAAALPKAITESSQAFPFWLLCPQCPLHRSGWQIETIVQLLDDLADQLPIDRSRIYATGVSMGGRGVYELAYDYGNSLAAIVPICAFGIPNLAPRLSGLPIWAFHGELDEVVPLARGAEMVEALLHVGSPTRFTTLQGEGHNIGSFVYKQPELWQWLLSQQKEFGSSLP